MCGVAGFVGLGQRTDIESMMLTITHRGPDGCGIFQDQKYSLYLGHLRLSILDHQGGTQPMLSSDGRYALVFNGEIYNHRELREQLIKEGARFQSDHSDTEALLHSLILWGSSAIEKLNGMFAFAFYDKKEGKLTIARDHYGQKPLYYHHTKDLFAFSSELNSLCKHTQIKSEIDSLSLAKYFAHDYIPAPRTILKNISKLAPGTSLELNCRDLSQPPKISSYFNFNLKTYHPIPSFEEAKKEVLNRLQTAVERTLESDVPLGIFLSGGIDSSAVAYFASKASHRPIKTFSIDFDEKSYDESYYSTLMAKFIKSEHHAKKLSIHEAKQIIPDVLKHLDEPLGDGSLLPTMLVSAFAREHVIVCLGGDAADELFAGYDPFKAIAPTQFAHRLPGPLIKLATRAANMLPTSHENMSLDFKLKRFLRAPGKDPKMWASLWMSSLDVSEINRFLGTSFCASEIFSEALEVAPESNMNDQILAYYTKCYLPNDIFTKVDRSSMKSSLEVRAPFCDLALSSYVAGLPFEYKFKSGQTKYVLKEALKEVLPHEVLFRKKKGFGIPIASWLMDEDFFKFKSKSKLYDASITQRYLQSHRQKRTNEKAFLWNLYVLENSWVGELL